MFTTIRPVELRRFPSRSAATWPCTDCGRSARIDRSWTVEVETVDGRRFCIVLCDDCADAVRLVPDEREALRSTA